MPSILDTTVGGATANSYADTAFATAHLAKKRDVANWPAATTDQEKLLLEAMTPLEAKEYWGIIANAAQVLRFPREDTGDTEGFYDSHGRRWLASAIPTPIKEAQVEIALAIAQVRASFTGSGVRVRRYRTTDLEAEIAGDGGSESDLPINVTALLAPFLVKQSAAESFSVAVAANW